MKLLLTVFLKIPHHVVEIMFVLMVLLLAFNVVQSGVHHTCGRGVMHSVHLPFCWGVEPPTKFSKMERLDQISIFNRGLLGKRGVAFFWVVAVFI